MRRMTIMLAVLAMALIIAAPAFAGGTMNCGAAGYPRTTGYANGAHTHTVQGKSSQYVPVAAYPSVKNFSVTSGLKNWDVIGAYSESGYCIV